MRTDLGMCSLAELQQPVNCRTEKLRLMPRPCAVEAHARGFKSQEVSADATALCRGGSRFLLNLNSD
jgi:hypothetical protein